MTEASFLASCRILSEGVDVTGRRGVDGVVFADTRGSVVDIVQNVGRGLRQSPGEGKVARIIVPVFLQPEEDPQEMVASPSYRPLVAVLQGLRAHDERVIEQLVLLAEQRRAHRDGALRPSRFELLDELRLPWDVHDARFAEKLAVFRRYFEVHGTLAAPPGAMFEGQPVGQDLANLRKPAGLGKKPERAAERRARLEAIDPDWNPEWPVPWQRRWAKVRMCLTGGAALADLLPGVVVDGDDIGAWLVEQRASWRALSAAQRGRLEALGVPAPEDKARDAEGEQEGTAAGGGTVVVPATATAWERGIAAMRQYQQREGGVRVPRGHREKVLIGHGPDGGVVEEDVRLGVWRSNARSRRDKLTEQQLQEAQKLGLLT